jgi:hypothetical protein
MAKSLFVFVVVCKYVLSSGPSLIRDFYGAAGELATDTEPNYLEMLKLHRC